jgi:hypothetical protein
LAFVVLSFFNKFLKATTTLGSDMELRFGGSVRYESVLVDPDPNPPNPAPLPKTARLLDAWDLNCLLLIVREFDIV